MRFNYVIERLQDYLDKPDIDKKTLNEVFFIFYEAMSKTEQEVFRIRCNNLNVKSYYRLTELIENKSIQLSLDKFFKNLKRLKGINI